MNKNRFLIALCLILSFQFSFSQTWVDSLDTYARLKYKPADKYHWNWMNASLLYTMVKQYDNAPDAKKQLYLDYIQQAMDKSYSRANGKTPNAIASGLGMAFLYRVTGSEKYKKACDKIYADFLKINRTTEGAVSHVPAHKELWDDTVFMLGQFLLEMYKATGDEKYLNDILLQIQLHRDKLQDKESGLWVHGWDSQHKGHFSFGSQLNWADKQTGKSSEIWGRGNGWVVVTITDVLESMPKNHPEWNKISGYLVEMITPLPALQNKENGHWYQLTLLPDQPGNFIESSSTAMFAFGISKALQMGLVKDGAFRNSIDLAYKGLRAHSMLTLNDGYLTTKNVCKGTCIGDRNYYLKRKVKNEKPYSIGMFIRFGSTYEQLP